MATTQANPTATLEVRKSVFDLDSKEMVTLVKQGEFAPANSVEDFVSRMGNNAEEILKVINGGLRKYEESKLESSELPWKQVDEDDNGVEVISDFTGTPISEEKWNGFRSLINLFAKQIFGLKKSMKPEEKRAARDKAREELLKNPATIESLRG